MPLSLWNSLTRRLETFRPPDPERVGVYVCGPTVYDRVHIGNLAASLTGDLLVRWLRESGYGVTYVQNITDVEDRIIRAVQASGEGRAAFTQRFTEAYFEDLRALSCLEQVDHFPRATEHIDGMIKMIQALLDQGHAYLAEDGSIYFRIATFGTYGELAGLENRSLKVGGSGRIQADDYDKDAPADFALWKAHTPEDGDIAWEASFVVGGTSRPVRGRPGWHIECSAMSTALLGPSFDIHAGGEDLLFPHHQNEIAQSEGALGVRPFVRVWLHRRHLMVDGTKMSKRLGNVYTLDDLTARVGAGGAVAFRYLVLSSHYRSGLDFSWEALEQAARTLAGLKEARQRFLRAAAAGEVSETEAAEPFRSAATRFASAMNEDLSVPQALAAVHEAVREGNRRGDALRPADAAALVSLLDGADRVLGWGLSEAKALPLSEQQEELLRARERARREQNWLEADRLRTLLRAQGLLVEDTRAGQDVKRL